MFLCHATGFHARCWDAIVEQLPGVRSIAVDMRGHGQSGKPEPPIPWRQFGEDVAAIAREFGVHRAIGVGHSMGGHSVTLAAARVPDAFSELILLDPVIIPEAAYNGPLTEPHFARKRRNRWISPEAMFESFSQRAPFNAWDKRVLHDYCQYGLLPAPDGEGFVLACPPEIEGAIYEHSRAGGSNIYPEIESLDVPALVIRSPNSTGSAGMDMLASPTAPDLASNFKHGTDRVVEYSHFIPMEAPDFVASQILSALERYGTSTRVTAGLSERQIAKLRCDS